MAAPALLDRGVKLARLAVSLIFAGLLIVNPERRLLSDFPFFDYAAGCGAVLQGQVMRRINCGTVNSPQLQAWDLKPKKRLLRRYLAPTPIEVADGTGFAILWVGRAREF